MPEILPIRARRAAPAPEGRQAASDAPSIYASSRTRRLRSIAGRQPPSGALSADVPGSRGSTIALVSLSALALVVGGLLIARPDRTPERRARADRHATDHLDLPAVSLGPGLEAPRDTPGSAGPATARTAARRFLADYLRLFAVATPRAR